MSALASPKTCAACVPQGRSQERFADEAGIHRTYVSDLERGARNPTINVVERLAKPLGVSAGALLE